MSLVTKFILSNRSLFVTQFKNFVRSPCISVQLKHAKDIKDCANWLAHHLKDVGLRRVKVVATSRHPIVYAESTQVRHRPTVLVYGHYDVQPPDPLNEWRSPP